MTLTFENAFNGSFFITNGTFSLTEGPFGPFKPTPNSQELIQTDQNANVNIKFQVGGLLVPFLAGKWKGEVFLEKMGGDEYTGPALSNTIPYNPANINYSLDVNIPAGSIDEGIYRVVVCLTLESLTGAPGPVAAFGDLGILKYYEA